MLSGDLCLFLRPLFVSETFCVCVLVLLFVFDTFLCLRPLGFDHIESEGLLPPF